VVYAMPTKCSQLNIQIKFTIKVYLTSGTLSVGGLTAYFSKYIPLYSKKKISNYQSKAPSLLKITRDITTSYNAVTLQSSTPL